MTAFPLVTSSILVSQGLLDRQEPKEPLIIILQKLHPRLCQCLLKLIALAADQNGSVRKASHGASKARVALVDLPTAINNCA